MRPASLLPRFLRRSAPRGQTASSDGPPPRPARPPTPGQLRRERRALVHAREARIRDLGGIMLEMYKRDRFNDELVGERCDELVGLERRLQEIDGVLTQAAVARRAPPGSARCVCGAPVLAGSHFCANCGRPAGDSPVVTCVTCGSALPAEAAFCARCGAPTAESPAAHGGASLDAPEADDAVPEDERQSSRPSR